VGGAAARARLVEVLEPAVRRAGFDLEDVTITRAGSRSLLRVVVDRDGGVDLDAVAEASRVVGEVLDALDDARDTARDAAMPGPYVLEVTSPGVDRPLTAPRHWRRALGRLVRVVTAGGAVLTGRVVAADEQGALLATGGGAGLAGGVAVATAADADAEDQAIDDGADPGADSGSVVRVDYPAVRRAVVQVEFNGAAGGGHDGGADDEDGP
jgi:ribosome maturation factor RimP